MPAVGLPLCAQTLLSWSLVLLPAVRSTRSVETLQGDSVESGRIVRMAWVECRCARYVALVLIVVRKVPSRVQGVELSPLCPAMMLPECRKNLRFGPVRCGCVHPGLVQGSNPSRHGLEWASVLCGEFGAALVRVWRLKVCSIALLLLLLLKWRAWSLVPLLEREAVPTRDQSRVCCEAHGLELIVTHTNTPEELQVALWSCDTGSISLLATVADPRSPQSEQQEKQLLMHFISPQTSCQAGENNWICLRRVSLTLVFPLSLKNSQNFPSLPSRKSTTWWDQCLWISFHIWTKTPPSASNYSFPTTNCHIDRAKFDGHLPAPL